MNKQTTWNKAPNKFWQWLTIERKTPDFEAGSYVLRQDRLFAAFLDFWVQVLIFIPIAIYLVINNSDDELVVRVAYVVPYQIIMTLLVNGYLIYRYGQTVGKHAVGVRIENLDGTKAKFSQIVFARMLPMIIINAIPIIGQIIAWLLDPAYILGKERRCLHDYIAKTKVSYIDI